MFPSSLPVSFFLESSYDTDFGVISIQSGIVTPPPVSFFLQKACDTVFGVIGSLQTWKTPALGSLWNPMSSQITPIIAP